MKNKISRRTFFRSTSIPLVTLPFMNFNAFSVGNEEALISIPFDKKISNPQRKVYIFSKHLHWLNYSEMAKFVSECGFDGVDLTVREGGHVEPKTVQKQLPLAIKALKDSGKNVEMITTSIKSVNDPQAEEILKTASEMGVKIYRLGWLDYKPDKTIEENLDFYEAELKALAELNKKYKIAGAYQNHSGTSLGAPVWDLGILLKKINSEWLGSQYDIRHAALEGANSWKLGFNYIKPFINSLDIKDFYWTKENEKWKSKNCPLGEGMIDFESYFQLIKNLPISIPICLHLEYPIGGAEEGNKTISISPEKIKEAMKKDLDFIKKRL